MKNEKLKLGIVLIVVGLFILLFRFGILDVRVINSIIGSLFALWPLILVVVGINMIFSSNKIVRTITWVSFVVLIILHSLEVNLEKLFF